MNWTAAEDIILRTHYGTVPAHLVAQHLPGRSGGAVQDRGKKLGLKAWFRPCLKISRPCPTKPSRARYIAILTEECLAASVPLHEALSRSRRQLVVYPRWRTWRRLRAMNFSLPGIGQVAGVDHSSVHHGLARLKQLDSFKNEVVA